MFEGGLETEPGQTSQPNLRVVTGTTYLGQLHREYRVLEATPTTHLSNNIYMTVKIVLAASKHSNQIFMSGCKTSTPPWHRPWPVQSLSYFGLSQHCSLKQFNIVK